MDILFFKADWGLEFQGSLEQRLEQIAHAGFDGIESFFLTMEPQTFRMRCKDLGLKFIGGLIAPDAKTFRSFLPRILEAEPLFINCHGGCDSYSFEENLAFLRECMAIAKGEGDVPVVFETHRQHSLYSPWETERLLNALPDLRLCADFSHFTCVGETDMVHSIGQISEPFGLPSMVPDPVKARVMDLAISRSDHIHARVGTDQAPQVADPRRGEGPEWCAHFEQWWDRIVARAREEDRSFFTINPEYGPAPYAPCYPNRSQISDHWELAIWAMERLRARYISDTLDAPGTSDTSGKTESSN
ncbi:hypothetical protein P0082_11535 [Candidatus Haliotispira prima]|uniref:Sugar phosphate isomerase/epimerase n=1 Tax=Candidatus Haliotispira prima TaxID=3034016 RepID=A0ABY8MIT5_9SPIO|nr:hypothetical protein P0082_11535 [Candidatus Haliotispira prima]